MKQYCYLLADLTPELLQQECGSDYEAMRKYLRQRGVDAYCQKVRGSAGCWACSFPHAAGMAACWLSATLRSGASLSSHAKGPWQD